MRARRWVSHADSQKCDEQTPKCRRCRVNDRECKWPESVGSCAARTGSADMVEARHQDASGVSVGVGVWSGRAESGTRRGASPRTPTTRSSADAGTASDGLDDVTGVLMAGQQESGHMLGSFLPDYGARIDDLGGAGGVGVDLPGHVLTAGAGDQVSTGTRVEGQNALVTPGTSR